MYSVFLILLAIALLAGYLFLNVAEEIERVLAIATLAVCSLAVLAIAPWPIQLAIFLFVLFGMPRLPATE